MSLANAATLLPGTRGG